MINVVDSPEHVRIHTLRKVGISLGEVALVIHEKRMAVEPYQVYPIEGEASFEALDFYLPFDNVFGTKKPEYNEAAITERIQSEHFHRVRADKPKEDRLTGTQLAILGAAGYTVIIRSAYRTEGATYEERILNLTIHCPVNGGGMIRIANCPVDIANPTFNPHAETPKKPRYRDLTLLEAFNRTHKPRTDAIEDRRRKRIEEAEANMRANTRALPERTVKALPGKSED